MKKTVMTCLAIAALLAVASTAGAVTCTVDQRPAATLLVPYFQVSYDPSGTLVSTGLGARDTIVTIGNASSAPTIAHVTIYDRQSVLIIDFNVALTAFDVQSMRMSDIFAGTLPNSDDTIGFDVCQRAGGEVYPDPDGFLRVFPLNPSDGGDNTLATTAYPPFPGISGSMIAQATANCDGGSDLLAIGYMVIDMVNYCSITHPQQQVYFLNDAAGMENNLFGEIIFTSGFGLPTYGMSTVNLEADDEFGNVAQATSVPVRTFYAQYWNDGSNGGDVAPAVCPNCGTCTGTPPSNNPADVNFLNCRAPWDVGYGDQREPLGLKWAARWFDASPTITSFFRVWRNSITGGDCDFPEPIVTLTFFDEDEQTVTQGVCPSGFCGAPTFNFPLETQQRNINDFNHPAAAAGWVSMAFYNGTDGDVLDQAWVDYSFEGAIALESILVPGTQLDPSSCNPIGYDTGQSATIIPEIPTVPSGTGS